MAASSLSDLRRYLQEKILLILIPLMEKELNQMQPYSAGTKKKNLGRIIEETVKRLRILIDLAEKAHPRLNPNIFAELEAELDRWKDLKVKIEAVNPAKWPPSLQKREAECQLFRNGVLDLLDEIKTSLRLTEEGLARVERAVG